jgi:hypothetical protein
MLISVQRRFPHRSERLRDAVNATLALGNYVVGTLMVDIITC